MFKFDRRVHVYETDMMGIVHHSNYLRFCEEARVEFCKHHQLLNLDSEGSGDLSAGSGSSGVQDATTHLHDVADSRLNAVSTLAVLSARVDYRQPLRFHDSMHIEMQGRQVGVRLILQYKILKRTHTGLQECAFAETQHCAVEYKNAHMRVVKPSRDYLEKVKGLPWTETWL